MIAAAVDTIVEEGYYRASSNRIAERAGVTWGVIQYHFGTREQLLLAVAQSGADHLLTSLREADIHGATVEERLDSLADAIWSHYSTPRFLAHVQVLMNLSKDPRTSAATVDSLAVAEREVGGLLRDLVDRVVGEHVEPEIGAAVFQILRGLAIGEILMDSLPHGRPRQHRPETRQLLVKALATLIA